VFQKGLQGGGKAEGDRGVAYLPSFAPPLVGYNSQRGVNLMGGGATKAVADDYVKPIRAQCRPIEDFPFESLQSLDIILFCNPGR
jgi:hypothetical protein